MSEIKAEGLDEARAALDDVDQVVAIYGHTMDYGVPSHHLRYALTVADALAAQLAEVEEQLERARAVGPRWERVAGTYDLMIGSYPLASVYPENGRWCAVTKGRLSYVDTLPAAARAVCERLGLPVILDGLPDGGGK